MYENDFKLKSELFDLEFYSEEQRGNSKKDGTIKKVENHCIILCQ